MSAEDLVAAVRVHLDRVHDAVRRSGCGPGEAVEVVRASALDLVEVVAARPETVQDAVGWWFARAGAVGRGPGVPADPEPPLGGGVLSGDDDQAVLAAALDRLPGRARAALLLRDSYDLPDTSVGAALHTDAAGAMRLVAGARLDFLPLVDGAPSPVVADHQRDVGALARLAEGGPVAARDATVRRHALSCEACRAVSEAQQRAHLLLGGLTVVAVPEADRAGVLATVERAADAALPTAAELSLRAREEVELDREHDERRLFSPLLALLALVLAALVGVGVGLLLSRDDGTTELAGGEGGLPVGTRLASPSPLPPRSTAPPRTLVAPPPQTSVFDVPPPPPPPPPSPSPAPSPSLAAAPAAPAPAAPAAAAPAPGAPAASTALSSSPAAGPNGTVLTVTGTGWSPGAGISLDYRDPQGAPTGAAASAVADAQGRFTARLTAQDPGGLPGPHAVRATAGAVTATTTFTATA